MNTSASSTCSVQSAITAPRERAGAGADGAAVAVIEVLLGSRGVW